MVLSDIAPPSLHSPGEEVKVGLRVLFPIHGTSGYDHIVRPEVNGPCTRLASRRVHEHEQAGEKRGQC